MKVCLGQIRSYKGKVEKNLRNHLRFIEQAKAFKPDLIVFPELSLTGYEPALAEELATDLNDTRFEVFAQSAQACQCSIALGVPIREGKDIHICLLFFHPDGSRAQYAKQFLHQDEEPYFSCGKGQYYFENKGTKAAFGICYESLREEHFAKAKEGGATVYIASVAKPAGGMQKGLKYYPRTAAENSIPILLVNNVGFCDNFVSVGQSAVWDEEGICRGSLDAKHQGILIYDTRLRKSREFIIPEAAHTIEQASLDDFADLFPIYRAAKENLDKQGIYQWTDTYPNEQIIRSDIEKGVLYVLKSEGEIVGAMNLSEEQEPEYANIEWEYDNTKVMVLHRLVISPDFQGHGWGKVCMDFAEDYARRHKYKSIRLDAYSRNTSVINFYKNRAYKIRGEVHFPNRIHPFFCLEKDLR